MAKPFNTFKLFVCCTFLLLIGSHLNALKAEELTQSARLDGFLHEIEQKATQVVSFSCDFEQRRHLSIFSKPILFFGTLSIDRPDKMRWEITRPLPSIMLLDGENGVHCNGSFPPREFNTMTDPVMKIVSSQLWSWLSGDYLALRKKYRISQNDDFAISLEPLEDGVARVISAVIVRFDQHTLQPESVVINEAGQDYTEILFSNYHLNVSFADQHFAKCYLK